MIVKITPRDRQLISLSRIEKGGVLTLPPMTDTEYDSIKYIVESLGGHWRERVKGFNFDITAEELQNRLLKLIESDYIELSNDKAFKIKTNFYPTPSWLAYKMVLMAEIQKREMVLEPSAGKGAILRHIADRTNHYYAVEYNRELVKYLRDNGYRVNAGSFENYYKRRLSEHKQFDKVIMNPPYHNKLDLKHTVMGYNLLKVGGKLVGLVAENSLYYDREITQNFMNFLHSVPSKVISIPHGTFKESGTNVDVSLLIIEKNSRDLVTI